MHRLGLVVALGCVAGVGCGDDGSGSADSTGATTGSGTSASSTMTVTETGTQTGTGTSGSSGVVDGSTGGDDLCGNGVVDPGEDCDDENDEQTDECANDCTVPIEELWTVSYDGGASRQDSFNDVVLDDAGNIYVVGSHRTETTHDDLVVKQYMPDGSEGWTYAYAGPASDDDVGHAVAWHPSGDLVVVGTTMTAAEGSNGLVLRLSTADQSEVWVDDYDGPGTGATEIEQQDLTIGVAVDSAGGIIMVGSQANNEEQLDILVRKLDPSDGSEIWQQTFSGAFGEVDRGFDVAVDSADDIYVVGLERVAAGDNDGWLRKYDGAGTEIWTQSFDWSANAIEVDADGNIVLAGGGSVDTDVTVAKYDPDFTELWLFSYQGPGDGFDSADGLFLGDGGEIYVAGGIAELMEQGNFWTAKLDPDGNPLWATSYNNDEANVSDRALGLAVDANGDVVAVGLETVLDMQTNGFIRKLAQL